MANDLTGNPWIIDTASATPVTTDTVYVDFFEWVIGTDGVADDALVVTDNKATPDVEFAAFASGKNQTIEKNFAGSSMASKECRGLIVSTLGRGKLYVHLA